MAGDGALFTHEDAVEAALAELAPVPDNNPQAHRHKTGGWEPKQADALMAAGGSWHNPLLAKASK